MSVIFHPNVAKLVVGRGLIDSGIGAASGISIYSGVQPAAQDIVTNWVNYKSTNPIFLINYSGVVWSQPFESDVSAQNFCSIITFPAAKVPTNPGTGTWCIIWASNPTDLQLASDTIPNTKFIVAPVSNLTGAGVVRFNPDTIFASGVSKAIADGTILITSV